MATTIHDFDEIVSGDTNQYQIHNLALHQIEGCLTKVTPNVATLPVSPSVGDALLMTDGTLVVRYPGGWTTLTVDDRSNSFQTVAGVWYKKSGASFVVDRNLTTFPKPEAKSAAFSISTATNNSVQMCTGTFTITLNTPTTVPFRTKVYSGSATITISPGAGKTLTGATTIPLGDSRGIFTEDGNAFYCV